MSRVRCSCRTWGLSLRISGDARLRVYYCSIGLYIKREFRSYWTIKMVLTTYMKSYQNDWNSKMQKYLNCRIEKKKNVLLNKHTFFEKSLILEILSRFEIQVPQKCVISTMRNCQNWKYFQSIKELRIKKKKGHHNILIWKIPITQILEATTITRYISTAM